MKILRSTAIIVLLSTIFLSCSEDPKVLSTEETIKGEWNMTELSTVQITNQVYTDGSEHTFTATGTSSDIRVTANFNDDNTFITKGLFTISLESTGEDGQTNTTTFENEDYDTHGTFAIDGDNLILNLIDDEANESYEATYVIKHISNNRLELFREHTRGPFSPMEHYTQTDETTINIVYTR